MSRPMLYVCAPYATRTAAEMLATEDLIHRALGLGWCPVFAPSLLERYLDDASPEDRAVALECALSILPQCDALLVVGDRVTEGMRLELDAWKAIGRVAVPAADLPRLALPRGEA